MSEKQQLFELLLKDYYILYMNGELVITNKLIREFASPLEKMEVRKEEPKVGQIVAPTSLMSAAQAIQKSNIPEPDMNSPMAKFILDAEIPGKAKTATGYYWLNKYSKQAEKELIKILSQGYQYDILVASTKLYYKSGGFPKAITNYIVEGYWKGCYEDMKTSLDTGNVEQFIKKSLDNDIESNGFSRYTS